MSKIKIITDSTTSLSPEECKKMNIDCLETSYVVDDEAHSAFDDQSETLEMFYDRLDKIKSCSTGCINGQTFEDCFRKYTGKGEQVLYLGLSASLSSTYENAFLASEKINKEAGKKMVATVDSRSASFGTLILIEEAEQLIKAGKSLDEIQTTLSDHAKNMSVAFVCRDLSFLQKSGRIGVVEASVGKILHIVPIVYVSESGKLKTGDKCLGNKKAIATLKSKFQKFIEEKHHTKCYITSCGLDADAENFKDFVLKNTQIKEVKTGLIDKTLACCCGPKTLAIFCG